MIKGLAISARVFDRQDHLDAAHRALDFLRRTMWTGERLLATYKDGKAHLNAYLDDYAFLIEATLACAETRWRPGDLDFAIALTDAMLDKFEDDNGGFFFTSHDHETLIQRSKPLSDDALPAGAGVAALCLLRLGHLLGENRYLQSAERCLSAAWNSITQMPGACNALALALEEYLHPTETVILRGPDGDPNEWLRHCHRQYAPARLTVAIPSAETDLPGLLAQRSAADGGIAYICRGHQCEAPITTLEEFIQAL